MQRFENELPVPVLKLIIKEIDKEASNQRIDWTSDSVYDRRIMNLIDNSVKKFGITDIEYESYGFFWKLYQENHNFDGAGDIMIPRMMKFPITVKGDITKYGIEIYGHYIFTYDKEYVHSMIYKDPDFEYFSGEFIDEEIIDAESGTWELVEIGKPKLFESKKYKKVLTESENRELQDLLKMKMLIEKRIKTLSS